MQGALPSKSALDILSRMEPDFGIALFKTGPCERLSNPKCDVINLQSIYLFSKQLCI